MAWHPNPEDRAAWSTPGDAVMAVGAAGAITWLLALEPSASTLPPGLSTCSLE
jgi:hypothetical protein